MKQHPEDPRLNKHQIDILISGKKHWSEKQGHIKGLLKNWGYDVDVIDLEVFMEEFVPAEELRLRYEYFQKSKQGIIKTKYTPTDVKGDFRSVDKPVIGTKYHISWAYSGAVFKLVKIVGDECFLDNPRHKRKELLKCKLSELRHIRNR